MHKRQRKSGRISLKKEYKLALISAGALVIAAIFSGWIPLLSDKPLVEKYQERESFFTNEYDGFLNGKIIFICPDDMEVNKATLVKAYITKKQNKNINDFKNSLIEELNKISPIMKSQLIGSAFDVREITSQKQSTIGETTSWEWYVTPLKSGYQNLVLSVDAIVEIPGYSDRSKNVKIIEKTIYIEPWNVRDTKDILDIIENVTLVTIIVLFIVYIQRKRVKIAYLNERGLRINL